MKLLALLMVITLGTGCASAETKLASKQDYRKQQVEAIKVQKQADTVAAQAAAAERVAMWQALEAAVKANPESASHMAIVAAVSTSSGSPASTVTRSNVVSLNKEREEAQAIDYLKVLTPGLIGGVTQAGIAAITNETARDRISANRDIRIQEIVTDGQVWSAINNAIDELDDSELTSGSSNSSGGTVDAVSDDVADDDVADDSVADDDVVDVVDDGTDDVTDDPVDDNTDDTTDDTTTPDVDCSVSFSPAPPECL